MSALPGGGAAPPVAAAERGLAIGVGPVTLPKYLDRPQIETFTSPYALNLAEFDRWAEPLESNFIRVLAENLALLLPTARVVAFSCPGSTPLDYQVTVEVSDFSGPLGRSKQELWSTGNRGRRGSSSLLRNIGSRLRIRKSSRTSSFHRVPFLVRLVHSLLK